MADPFQIQKEPVHGRDESGSRLFGWTFSEMGTVAGPTLFAVLLGAPFILVVAVFLFAFWYARFLKQKLPERFLSNAFRYHTRRHDWYRASARDSLWRHPVKRG